MKKTTKTTTTKRTRLGKLTITKIIQEELNASAPQPVAVTAAPITIQPPAAPAPQLTNEVIFVLDDSGSMSGCYDEAIKQLNSSLARVREEARTTGQKTAVSLYIFSDYARCIFQRVPVEQAQPVSRSTFTGGMTALASAMCKAMDDGLQARDANDPNKSYLLVVITDGGENRSYAGDIARNKALINQVQKTDRWTLACMVPRGNRHHMIALGVPAGNITEWDNDVAGAQVGFQQTNVGVSSYYATRSRGETSTKQFYTTDLAKLTTADLAKMDDVSGAYKAVEINKVTYTDETGAVKEHGIQSFVEREMGLPFYLGAGYYLLMKKEVLRDGRNVLVVEKGSKRVFGGTQARQILGLPAGEVTVTPGNHANYDVYFQSTSRNRKLTRGTKLYYDIVTRADLLKETWDSAAAQKAADLKKAQQPVV